jgi:LmbE family N-acetylglucosaminyl deacetylase
VSTLLCFHAHPDDEALSTGGLMASAAAAGHRVILVTATRGEQGEPQPGVLEPGEVLWERRVVELAQSASVLGAEPPHFLGYEDSGMMGEPTNDNPACFWQADIDEAAERLAAILSDVEADVLTIYDDHGLYGHPDHIQVHRVGLVAARLMGVEHVFEATVNREWVIEGMARLAEEAARSGAGAPPDDSGSDEMASFGVPHQDLVYYVDVSDHLAVKRAAMAAHRSQIPDSSFFLALPDETAAEVFGLEWYAVPGRTGTGGPDLVELLPGL